MNIETLCSPHTITVSLSAPISEVARLMRDEHVGAVVVTAGDPEHLAVAGILTDRDIVRAQLTRTADLASLSAQETMTRDPLVLPQTESVSGAILRLRERGVRRAPVVDPDGTPIGLISVDDLLAHLAITLTGVAGIIAQQIRREAD